VTVARRAPARRLRGCGSLLALALACGPAPSAADPARDAESAGGALLAAAERSVLTVTGTIREVQRLDARGFAARLETDRVLAGTLPSEGSQRIAWEEFSSTRPPRFADGERILVALEALPTASIWRGRFPAGDALRVGAEGHAALKAPDAASVDALARYLALDPAARASETGDAALLGIVAEATPPLAEAALQQLGERPGLDARLGPAARDRYALLLGDASRPLELRSAALALAGARRLAALREPIERHATPGNPLEAQALEALVRIDGSLPAERALRLLARDDASLRSLALRFGGEAIDAATLAERARADAAPEVRLAAGEALVARRGAAALDEVLPMLFDRDPEVCREMALRIARLGDVAVPPLRALLAERPYDDVSELGPSALGLAMAGPLGVAALQEIHAEHPDEKRRKLAGLALGRLAEPGHAHP
jgi:hypothetical protein